MKKILALTRLTIMVPTCGKESNNAATLYSVDPKQPANTIQLSEFGDVVGHALVKLYL